MPAEFPPESFAGGQYTDSRGCVFARAGSNGSVTWVPVLGANRQPLCVNDTASAAAPAVPPEAAQAMAQAEAAAAAMGADVLAQAQAEAEARAAAETASGGQVTDEADKAPEVAAAGVTPAPATTPAPAIAPVATAEATPAPTAAPVVRSTDSPAVARTTSSEPIPFGSPAPEIAPSTVVVTSSTPTSAPQVGDSATVVIPSASRAQNRFAAEELTPGVRRGVELNPEYAAQARADFRASSTPARHRSHVRQGRIVQISAENGYGVSHLMVPGPRGPAWSF